MDCQYCQKTFSVKQSLIHHQKTAKYCLEKQGLNNTFKCNYCFKILTTNARLQCHFSICKIKSNQDVANENEVLFSEKLIKKDEECHRKMIEKDNEYNRKITEKDEECSRYLLEKTEMDGQLKQKDAYITKLELMLERANETIAEIARQPKTMTHLDHSSHIQNNNRFDIDDIQKISRLLDMHLTPDVMRRGQEGVAEMLKERLLKTETGEPIYECTDVARQKFEFRNADGNMETDPKATKLIRSLGRSGVWNKAHSTGKKLWEKADGTVNVDAQNVFMPHVTEVLDMDKDSSKLRSRLASITARQKKSVKK